MAQKESTSNSYKMKHPIKRPLENKSFFLHLTMYPGEIKLAKNLKLLGAKQEQFFDSAVSFVVVNNWELVRNASGRPFKMPSKPQNWTPLTPITNTTCPSPLFNESSMDYLDSPSYLNSPATDQNAVPTCRGMAFLKEAAKLKKQATSTTDGKLLMEKCKKFNVKVLHVDEVVAKVEKMKAPFIVHFVAEKKRTQNGERKLKPPFLKVEDAKLSKRSWTWHREFSSSTFNTKLANQVKELYNHFKKSGNIQVTVKPVLGETKAKKYLPNSSMAQPLAFAPSVSKSFSKFSDTTAKPSTAFSVCNGKRKLEEQAPVVSKKQKTSQVKKKKFYCEICKVNYVNLDRHLETDSHRIFMRDPMNFLEIQNIITSFPKKEDFLMSRSFASDTVQTWDLAVDASSLAVDNFQVEPQDYPTTYGISVDSHFYTSQHLTLNSVVPGGEFREADTEPYSLIDEIYVSPSCTSPESRYMPYLEESTDGLGRSTPLNLSKKESVTNQEPLGAGTTGNVLENSIDADTSLTIASPEVLKILNGAHNVDNDVSICNSNLDAAKDSKLVNELEREIDLKDAYDTSQEVPIAVDCSMGAVTVDLASNEMLNAHQLPNGFNQNAEFKKLKSTYFLTEESPSETVPSKQIFLIKNDTEVKEDNIVLTTFSINEKNPQSAISAPLEKMPNSKAISNDSGFGTLNSPPPNLAIWSSPKEHTSALRPDDCCALDLSTVNGNLPVSIPIELPCNINVLKDPSSDQMCSMPDLSLIEADGLASVLSSECMPMLVPVYHGNEVKMGAFEAQNSAQTLIPDSSLPVCERTCSETESKETLEYAQNTSPPFCVPMNPDIHDNVVYSNLTKTTYSQMKEEALKSCNDVDMVPSSSTSFYEVVEEAEFSDTEECDWENIHSNVNDLCDSFCREDENVDSMSPMCS